MTTLTFTDVPLLLVEDDAVFRDLLSQRLEALGFTVQAAEDLESAEQLVARQPSTTQFST
jgi:CheY-like chemotaxis protein